MPQKNCMGAIIHNSLPLFLQGESPWRDSTKWTEKQLKPE